MIAYLFNANNSDGFFDAFLEIFLQVFEDFV